MATVKSLAAKTDLLRQDVKDKEAVKARVMRAAADRGILLVRTNDLPSEGLLSERQQQWINSAPYDARTQNPTLYKHEVDQARLPRVQVEREEARQEVQSLPEIVTRPALESGGVEVRLREARKERHEGALQDMKEELALISTEYETKIQYAIDTLKSSLAENKQVVADLFKQVSTQEDLRCKSLADLKDLWEQLSTQTTVRQKCIDTLDTRLSDLETERAGSVTEVLHNYAQQITKIAYLLPNDVERLFEEEAHFINTALLENRRVYTQLCMHLHTGELSVEREHRDHWESTVTDWKELVCQSTLTHFQTFFSSEEVMDSPELQRVRDHLTTEQKAVQRRREALMSQLSDLAPPKATRASVYELKASADKLHQQLGSVHTSFLLDYQSVLESLSRLCESEMDRCKFHLVSSGAVDSSSIHTVLNNLFVPHLERVASRLREELHELERGLDAALSNQKGQFETLFSFCEGAALLWDQHSDSLSALLRTFQERLDGCRTSHDHENQNLEANLDLLLDRLRQGPTQEALKEYLQEALRMLDTIKRGYERFHMVVLEEVRSHPELIQKELDWYDNVLCQYLGVSRTPVKKSKSLTRAPSEMQVPSSRAESRGSRMDSRGGIRQESRAKLRKPKPQRSKTTASGMGQSKPPLATISSASSLVEEAITTSGGVTFYLLQSTAKSSRKEDGTFLTQDEESEDSVGSFATESIALTQEVFVKTKEKIVLGFLEQLEQWKSSTINQAQATLTGKEEECHTELDLRLHLHEPRPSRVEQDIHNVRLAELIAHRDRVTRHATGLTTSLALQRGAGERLKELLTECGERFAEYVEGLMTEFDTSLKTSDLLKVQSAARESLEQHIEELTRLSDEHSSLSSSVLHQLSESNTAFRNSIKLFSEGGNYCPEEVDLFVKKLDKLSGKVSSTLAHITSEMSSVTEDQVNTSSDQLDQFDSVFKLHFADLTFLEAISRTLTSAQVKIKSEVLDSNAQCTVITDHISELRRMVEQTKSRVPSSDILSHLPPLFKLLADRVDYLYCRAVQFQGSRVGGLSGVTPSGSGLRPIGSMNVTRSIMDHISRPMPASSASDRRLSDSPTPSVTKPLKKERRLSLAPAALTSTNTEQRKSGKQSRKKAVAILERKNVNFGIGGGDEDLRSFLPRIRAILKASHAELFDLCESYYREKGSRLSTRPGEIHESFEGHMDTLIGKSQSYRSQAEEYRNNCIQEFRDQLSSVIVLVENIPRLVFTDLLQEWTKSGREACETALKDHASLKETSNQEKLTHQKSLRPNLGHPSQSDTLEALNSKEDIRHREMLSMIEECAEQMRSAEKIRVMGFGARLTELTKTLLTLFDSATTESDVIPGNGENKEKRPMVELLRKHVQGTLTPDPSSSDQLPHPPGSSSGKTVWPTLPQSDLVLSARGQKKQLVEEKLISQRSTSAHEAVVRERDSAFTSFCGHTEAVLEEVKLREEEEMSLEEKWFENWTQSVHKVKQLYSD